MLDLIVIGGGPGGYTAAARAAQLGLSTALIEKENLGGTCANWGCIPTKALLKNAEAAHLLTQGRTYGFTAPAGGADYAAAHSRSRQVAKRQSKRVEALVKGAGVTLIAGTGAVTAPGEVTVLPGGEVYRAKHILLAAGGSPRVFPGWHIDGSQIITSREALMLNQAPPSVAIIGAGPIGLEFATVWRRYGSAVTVLEAMPRIMPLEDEEISREAENQYRKAGITLRTGVKVEALTPGENGVDITLGTPGGSETLHADTVLAAVGTAPALAGLVDHLDLTLQRGFIAIDDNMATSLPGLYAIGDITGKLPLAHTASAQALIAIDAITGRTTTPLTYEHIPRCVFGLAEVASVGLSEQQARAKGIHVTTAKAGFLANGKAVAIQDNTGFVKIVADDKGTLLGVHMTGPHVTELIAGPATWLALGLTAAEASRAVYPHPTLSEVLGEALGALTGRSIH